MLLLIWIVCVVIQNPHVTVEAEKKSDDENLYEGYAINTDNDKGMEFYLRDLNNKDNVQLVYCFSNGQLEPPLLNSGKILPQYHEETLIDNKGYKALLYVGYPLDKEGLIKKYGLNAQEAHKETQSALWTLQNADLSVYMQYKEPYPSYYVELLSYVAHHVNTEFEEYSIAYYVSNTFTNENLSYQHMITLTKIDNKKPVIPKNPSDDADCGCVSKQRTSDLQFWSFISGAIVFIVIIIIWYLLKNKKMDQ